jgi:hypothetical protein
MELFHVSFIDYKVGEKYFAPNPIDYHLWAIAKGEGWINEQLDLHRPRHITPHVSSFYACDLLENCQAFIGTKKIDSKSPTYYRVDMDSYQGYPMVLTDRIKKVGLASPRLEELINEYWTPTKKWKYLEYLNSMMTIIKKLPLPNVLIANKGKMNYMFDYDLAKQLFS